MTVCAGCNFNRQSPEVAPGAAAADGIVPETPTALPTATLPVTPAPPAEASVEIRLSPTISVTVSPTPTLAVLITSQILNIRAGPGLDYPVIGHFGMAADAPIVGRAENGQWWKVECPEGLDVAECWVIADEELVAVSGESQAPEAPAPPVPLPTPEPTSTPCTPSAPSGWVAYQVQAGDTLSAIASRTGSVEDKLRGANCLSSETIISGTTLFVPEITRNVATRSNSAQSSASSPASGGTTVQPSASAPSSDSTIVQPSADVSASSSAAVQPPASVPSSSDGAAQPTSERQQVGFAPVAPSQSENVVSITLGPIPVAASDVSFVSPGFGLCPSAPDAEARIFIGTSASDQTTTWSLGERIGICVQNYPAGDPIALHVEFPDGSERSLGSKPADNANWTWVTEPDKSAWADTPCGSFRAIPILTSRILM